MSGDGLRLYGLGEVAGGGTLADAAAAQLRERPEKIAVVDGDFSLSFAELNLRAARLARALQDMGLRAGDVISFQLPNWHEAMVINLAASTGGFVCNRIVPIYRDAELAFILKNAGTKVFFLPEIFRGLDYAQMVGRMREGLPDLAHLVSVRADFAGAMPLKRLIGDDHPTD